MAGQTHYALTQGALQSEQGNDDTAVPLGTADGLPGTRRVEPVMGTMIGVDVRDRGVSPTVLDEFFEYLRDVDRRYSTFKPNSEISRIARGELPESEASPDVRWVLAMCDDLCRTTGGYFDARRHRPDGRLDPSGLVKGWSVEEASLILDRAGLRNYAVNAGGDVIVHGEPTTGRPWRVGIRHPRRTDRLAAVLELREGAVATSGAYERGDHILDPHTGRPPTGLLSVTVAGPSLATADVYATTAYAMGPDGAAWVARQAPYGAYVVTTDEHVVWTPEMARLLA